MEEDRKIVVAIDESATATFALRWAIEHLLRPKDHIHLVNVLPPLAYSLSPASPIATGQAVAAVAQSWEAQKKHDSQVSLRILSRAKEMVQESFKEDDCTQEGEEPGVKISIHQLPATGGASGVAESLVTFCKNINVALLVLGSRGMGSFQRSIMGLVGLGSVSHYCAHHLVMPILIVRGDETPVEHAETSQTRGAQVMFAMDEQERSREALGWFCENFVRENDTVHITSVALPSPLMVADGSGPEWFHQTTSAEEVQGWEEDQRKKRTHAEKCCQLGMQIVKQKSSVQDEHRILGRALQPEGGASDIAASLCHYANTHNISLVAMGARHMGDMKRSVMNIIGLGSVSDYCVNNLHCPVLLYKVPENEKEH
eukprot:TRINITY_DN12576_c0_g1_i4.p2 TRINITY_DN12576_c0_g1~~TRINITY_DN12576_c0_g1_i4.p2  ORF type:complete len:371 (-),score=55.72 TRINITY_DN12576_c0_g1_i4:510-1622(-)